MSQFELRLLGIKPELPGSKFLQDFVERNKIPKHLNFDERKQILEAWDSRNCVPSEKKEFVDTIKPEAEEGSEAYEVEYVELIFKYLQTIY